MLIEDAIACAVAAAARCDGAVWIGRCRSRRGILIFEPNTEVGIFNGIG